MGTPFREESCVEEVIKYKRELLLEKRKITDGTDVNIVVTWILMMASMITAGILLILGMYTYFFRAFAVFLFMAGAFVLARHEIKINKYETGRKKILHKKD